MIVRYTESLGRMGLLDKTFACSELELRALKAWGEYHHGEVLGKHSDITGTFSDETLKILTDDKEFIDKAIGYGLVGGCPFAKRISEWVSDEPEEMLAKFVSAGITGDEYNELAQIWHFNDPDDA